MEVIASDTFFWANNRIATTAQSHSTSPWLVFCSPPYDLFVSHFDSMMELIATVGTAAPTDSLMVVEADKRFDMGNLSDQFTWDVRSYPPAVVALGRQPS